MGDIIMLTWGSMNYSGSFQADMDCLIHLAIGIHKVERRSLPKNPNPVKY